MHEVLTESIQWLNLPFTVLLGMVILYWCLVMLGVVDMHLFGDGDIDLHTDLHTDVHADVHAEVDGDADFEPAAHLDGGAHPLVHGDKAGDFGGSFLFHALSFLNIGRVPLMFVVSVLSLCLWVGSLIANHYFTGGSATLALAALVPNFILSVFATRYITMPFRPVFRAINREREDRIHIVGQRCTIVTSEATPEFGQAEIKTEGAPLLLNVRTINDARCVRGEVAVVVRHDSERGIHFIAPLPINHPNTPT
jgi:hypothetical protein